jgi:ribonuclease E
VTAEAEAAPAVEAPVEAPAPELVAEEAPAKPKRTRKKAVTSEAAPAPAVEAAPVAQDLAPGAEGDDAGDEGTNEDGTPRRGWWQRTFGA